MATLIVNSNLDTIANDGVTTLREALLESQNNGLGADEIVFDAATMDNQTISLTSGALQITSGAVSIKGDIEGDGKLDVTLSGNAASGFFTITGATTNVAIDSLTMTNGNVNTDNGTVVGDGVPASAISNTGILTISNSEISNTTVLGDAGFGVASGALFGSNGGNAAIISSSGSLNILDTIIRDSTITAGAGGRGPDGRGLGLGSISGYQGGTGGHAAAIISSGNLNLQNTELHDLTVTGGAGGRGGDGVSFTLGYNTYYGGSGAGGNGGDAVLILNTGIARGECFRLVGTFGGGTFGAYGFGIGLGTNGQSGAAWPGIWNRGSGTSTGFDEHLGHIFATMTTGDDSSVGAFGRDLMWGFNGNDSIQGNDGNDDIAGGAGIDSLFGGNDDDVIEGGTGNDFMDGGTNGAVGDTVSFAGFAAAPGASAGISIDLSVTAAQNTGAGSDTITGFENVIGSDHDDLIIESGDRNTLQAGFGNDTLVIDGNFLDSSGEVFNGGQGFDTLVFRGSDNVFVHNLRNDMVTSIEAMTLTTDGVYQNRNIILSANQFGYGISLNAVVNFGSQAGNSETFDIEMGSQSALSLANLTFTGITGSARFIVTGDNDSETITGSSISDTLKGNGGVDTLNGGVGADQMEGGTGSDLYIVDSLFDTVFEAAAGGTADRVLTSVNYALGADQQIELFSTTNSAGTGAISLVGNNLANTILGNNGSNFINGGGGVDRMTGLNGNDLYYVDNALDLVLEGINGGTADRVFTSVDYTLAVDQQIEILSTINVAAVNAINLTGNNLANNIAGNNGVNIINGGGGIDSMNGQLGSDLYYVDNGLDTVLEGVNAGTADRVLTSVDYTLGLNQQIELFSTTNSTLTTAINLTGNNVANRILGNNGANSINGGLANDVLTGGLGADKFIFNTAIAGGGNIDTIADFVHLTDDIQLAQAIFTGIGAALDVSELRLGTSATTTTQRIVYDSLTGNVFFDSDGSAAGAQVQFAKVTAGTVLDINDFIMV